MGLVLTEQGRKPTSTLPPASLMSAFFEEAKRVSQTKSPPFQRGAEAFARTFGTIRYARGYVALTVLLFLSAALALSGVEPLVATTTMKPAFGEGFTCAGMQTMAGAVAFFAAAGLFRAARRAAPPQSTAVIAGTAAFAMQAVTQAHCPALGTFNHLMLFHFAAVAGVVIAAYTISRVRWGMSAA